MISGERHKKIQEVTYKRQAKSPLSSDKRPLELPGGKELPDVGTEEDINYLQENV
jgi:hypothetical protein